MKTARKVMLLIMCAVLLVCASIAGTVAYLTSQASVKNTFTVGKVNITMDESAVDLYGQKIDMNSDSTIDELDRRTSNQYKLIPGHTYTKDPIIHVASESEACFVFVKIENGLADIIDADTIETQLLAKGWTQLLDDLGNKVAGVYYKNLDLAMAYDGEELPVFDYFKLKNDANVASFGGKEINITGYAIQSDGFSGDSYAAWTAGGWT